MAAKTEQKPWHPMALKMRAEGRTPAEICKALGTLADPPSPAAVRKYLDRAAKDPAKALQVLGAAPPLETPVVPFNAEQTEDLAVLIVTNEKAKAAAFLKALSSIEAFQSLTVLQSKDADAFSLAKAKALLAVETLKALKSTGLVADIDVLKLMPGAQAKGAKEIREIRLEVVSAGPRPEGS